jgi:hypothetical protein
MPKHCLSHRLYGKDQPALTEFATYAEHNSWTLLTKST